MKYLFTIVLAFTALQLASCGKSNEQIAKEQADSAMAVRSGIYDVATSLVKTQLKSPAYLSAMKASVPASWMTDSATAITRFTSVTAENTDTAAIFVRGDSALVRGEYLTRLDTPKFQVRLLRVNGKWICSNPEYTSMDLKTSHSGDMKDPDWDNQWSEFPHIR